MKTIWNRIIYGLLLLIVLSTFFVALTTARYTSTATGSDTATVAKFDVEVTPKDPNENSLNITKNSDRTWSSATYDFTVINNSEVTVNYDIIVELSEKLPEGVIMTLTDIAETDTTTTTPTLISTSDIITATSMPTPILTEKAESGSTTTYIHTFPSVGELNYKKTTDTTAPSKTHTLTFSIADSSSTNATISNQTISDISISVKAYQVN